MRRQSCAEISRLPKLKEGIRSINFRRTTPGSIFRIVHARRPPPAESVVDPTHPALASSNVDFVRAFPWRNYPGFQLRAVPHGLLELPGTPFPSPPYRLRTKPPRPGSRSVNMSLLDIAPRNVGGHVVRKDVQRKLKTAISLIVTRGADVEGPEGKEKLVFREADRRDTWVLHNWAYIVRPENAVYNMPYTKLIPPLREALQATAATGLRLEKLWQKMKDVTVRSSGAETPFNKRVPLASMAPPAPSKKEKEVQQSLTQVLARLARPLSEETQPEGRSEGAPLREHASAGRSNDAPKERERPPQEQGGGSLSEMIGRHLKRGLPDSAWGDGRAFPNPRQAGTKPPRGLFSRSGQRDS